MDTLDVVTISAYVVKATVFYADVADVFVVIQTDDKYTGSLFWQVMFFRCMLRTTGP